MPKDSIFIDRYGKLNKEQKIAVDTIEGPVMVIAGPGTGKTTILTLRIANILRKTDTPASGILALTFTDAGVKAMKMKLREIIGSKADEVRVHTFHSFAGSVISEYPEHFVDLSRSAQITDVESESILRNILSQKKYAKLRPLGDTDFYLHKILSAISEAKKEAWSAEEIRDFATKEIDRVKKDENSISQRGSSRGGLKADALKRIERCERTIIFSEVFREYEERKKEEKKIDFDDLLFGLVYALKKDKLLLQLLQEKFLYILIDEHQDTNDSQNSIVALLSSFFDTPNIFVVGDEKQAIYRFQGASVENFLRFESLWKNMKIISLTENYRSHQHILDASFSMIEKNYREDEYQSLRVKLKSNKKSKEPIDIVFTENTDSADQYLIDELKKINKRGEDTVAVILRWNRDVDHILSICEKEGIPVSAERGADVFSHPLGYSFFKVLEYLDDETRTDSLAETISLSLWDLSLEDITKLLSEIKKGIVSNIYKTIPSLEVLIENKNKGGIIDYLISVGELSGIIHPKRMEDPISLEVWRSIVDLAKDLSKNQNIENSTQLIKRLLEYKKTAENKQIKIGAGKSDSNIHIMTAHSSKGLEYDFVFLPYSLEEYWMRKSRSSPFVLPREKDTTDEEKDSRRLFFVALTRARKHAVVIIPKTDGLGKDFIPLRFIEELDKNSVLRKDIETTSILPKSRNKSDLSKHKRDELVEYTKRTLTERGLSVTALNHFLKCPSEFLYKSILKVPEAPNSSSEKGIAMHKAMSLVWQSGEKNIDKINKIIEDTIKDYFKNSLLSKLEREICLEELLVAAPKVALGLKEHWNLKGVVQTDRWFDSVFHTQYNRKDVDVTLHGQMDAILDAGNKLLVFDYKTKESMTENAIRGLTKNEDGGYFRQLVFYKLLLTAHYKDKIIEPALVFIKPDEKGRCPTISLDIKGADTKDLEEKINTLVVSVYSGDFLTSTCDDSKCQYCALKKYFV